MNMFYFWNISICVGIKLNNTIEDTLSQFPWFPSVIACVSESGWVWFATSVLLCFGANGYTYKDKHMYMCTWSVYSELLTVLARLIWAACSASAEIPTGMWVENTHTLKLVLLSALIYNAPFSHLHLFWLCSHWLCCFFLYFSFRRIQKSALSQPGSVCIH